MLHAFPLFIQEEWTCCPWLQVDTSLMEGTLVQPVFHAELSTYVTNFCSTVGRLQIYLKNLVLLISIFRFDITMARDKVLASSRCTQ